MITVRKSSDRGHFNFGWLDTYHSFAFGDYFPPASVPHGHGFRSLRVINQDVVSPGRGFGQHPHHDMEIITYVISGAVAHKDTTGGQETIRPGDVQVMTAGSGLEHSEFNPSKTEPLHLLQIWIRPSTRGLPPGYNQRTFPDAERRGKLAPIAAPKASSQDGSQSAQAPLEINQDAKLYASILGDAEKVSLTLAPGRHAWVQLVRGGLDVNGTRLSPGDGAAISDEGRLDITSAGESEFLVFDLG